MKRRARVFAVAPLAILFAACVVCGQEKSAGGGWQGAIELPGTELGIRVTLDFVSDQWIGKIDIPAQNARNVKLSDVLVEGRTVSWKLPGVPGDPSFFGRLSADGDAITGQFSQGGKSFPFKLARKSEARNAPPAPAPTPEPRPAAAQPKPPTPEARPAPAEPKPVPTEPRPAPAESRPAVAESKPVAEERKPSADELGFGGPVRGALRGKMDLDRRKNARPAHALDDYVGEYEHPTSGTLTVSREASGNLKAVLRGVTLRLEHWHYETFRGRGEDPGSTDVTLFFLFETNMKGDVDRVAVPLEPQVSEIVFTKRPARRS
jgi:hypothetical protein